MLCNPRSEEDLAPLVLRREGCGAQDHQGSRRFGSGVGPGGPKPGQTIQRAELLQGKGQEGRLKTVAPLQCAQLECLIRHTEDREISKGNPSVSGSAREGRDRRQHSLTTGYLQQQEARLPGSVLVRVSRLQRTVILIGKDLFIGPYSQKELELNEMPQSAQSDSFSG